MALDKQLVSVDFTSGLDTKTDAKLVLPGKLTQLENGVFRNKRIGKRYGSAALSGGLAGGGSIATPKGLAAFGSQLLLQDGDALRAYASGLQKWSTVPGGSSQSPLVATTTRTPVVRNNRSQDGGHDGAVLNGIGVYAWTETDTSASKTGFCIVDEASGAVLVQDGDASSGSLGFPGCPRVFAIDSRYIGIAWGESGGLNLSTVDTQNPTGITIATGMAGDLGSNCRFDIGKVSDGGTVLVYGSTGDTTIKAAYWAPGALPGTATSTASVSVGTVGTRGLSLTVDSDDDLVALVFDNAATVARAYVFELAAGALSAAGNMSLGTATAFDKSSGLAVTATAGDARLFWDDGTDIYTAKLNWGAGTHDASPTLFLRNARLATTPIEMGGQVLLGAVYQPLGSPSLDGEYTGFILAYDTSGIGTAGGAAVVGRVLPGLCQPQGTVPHFAGTVGVRLPRPILLSSTSAAFLFCERERLITGSQFDSAGRTSIIDRTPLGVSRIDFTRSSLAAAGSARLGDLLFIPAARPLYFDGAAIAEAGFHLYPDQLSVGSSGGGSPIAAGTYSYTAIYNWVDARGQLHRSAPAPAVQYTSTGTGFAPGVQAPCLQLTGKSGVAVEFYRTTNGGTVFYRLDSVSVPSYAPKDTAVVVYADSTTDTQLVSGEILYTTGGVLESIAAPACSIACSHRERLVVAGLEDPFEVRFTPPRVMGEAPRFNEDLSLHVPAQTGPVTGLASLDDKLVVFTQRAIYVVLGDGPDALGQGGTFSDPQAVPAASGCVSARSVVATPDGIMFQSERGISLLGHDLSVSYIGAEVEAHLASDRTIRSAVVVPDQNHVRFQVDGGNDLTTGIALVYDYLARQWSLFSTYGAVDATLCAGLYVRARSDGAILQETLGAFLDSGNSYSIFAETAWLKPAGLQGFQRVWRALLLGQCQSAPASLSIQVGYDYDATYADADLASFSGTVTTGNPVQLRLHLRKQKCEAIRFLIQETPGGGTGEGISLSNLTLEVGVRRGGFKLSSSKTVVQSGS